ncbi:MAG: choice-of-anchor J domain-containing protein [Candidatus Cloacimonetes bacterium]|nr:choice-of-anchor J domain-containing protein [Candidatus Cloacimonadota bacterium]
MKRIYLFILLAVFIFSIVHAQDKWTWMLYLYEDGTGLDGADDINEWEDNGSTADVNYLCLYDADNNANDGIYYIENDPGGYNSTIVSSIVSTHLNSGLDMNDWQTLEDYIIWCKDNYPADHYGLTVWDHGDGIFKGEITNGIIGENRGCVGDMKLWEMDNALSTFTTAIGRNIDIVGFDVCLLGHIETAYQLKDHVDYVIASEKTEPGDGWDYVAGFSGMTSNSNITPAAAATNIVDSYVTFYGGKNGQSSGVTQACTATSTLVSDLIPALDVFAEQLRGDIYNYETEIKTARDDASYWDSDTYGAYYIQQKDLGSFAENIIGDTSLPSALRGYAQDVFDAIGTAVIAEGNTMTDPAYGLKIWMPVDIDTDSNEAYYMDPANYLTFSNTKWDEFLYNYDNPQPYNPDFPPVQNLTANPGDGYVILNWDAPAKNTLDHYRVDRDGSTIASNVPVGTPTYTDNSVTNGLTYNYEVYAVYTGSPAGDSNPVSVNATPLAPETIPFTEGFENGGSIPLGWTGENVSGSTDWAFQNGGNSGNPNGANTGSYNAFLYYASTSGAETRLITPTIDFETNTDNTQLTFYHTQALWSPDQDQLRVYYKSSAGGSWNLIGTYISNITSWTQETIALPAPSSDYYIAFQGLAQYGHGVCIDDVQVTGTSSTPPAFLIDTTDLAFGDVEVGSNSTLQFTITNDGGGTLSGNITTPTGYTVVAAKSSESKYRDVLPYDITNNQIFDLTFTPTSAINYDDIVTITSNDPSNPSNNLNVTGNGVEAVISLSTTIINQTMPVDETSTKNLSIGNTGNANLDYTATVQYSKSSKDEYLNEGFENGSSIPTGWTTATISGSAIWTFVTGNGGSAPSTAHTGTYNALLKDNDNGPDKTRLITPSIDFGTGTTNTQLIFWHYMEEGNKQDELVIFYKTSSTGTWTSLVTYNSSVTSWTLRTISLPTPSTDYFIAFEGNAKNGNGVCIDDVVATGDPAGPVYTWLSINGSSSDNDTVVPSESDNLTIGFDAAGLTAGSYNATINISSNDANSPHTVDIVLTVDSSNDNTADAGGNNGDAGSGAASIDVPPVLIDGNTINPDVSVDPDGVVPIGIDLTVSDAPVNPVPNQSAVGISYGATITGNLSSFTSFILFNIDDLLNYPNEVNWWDGSSWLPVTADWSTPNQVSFDLPISNSKDGSTEIVLNKGGESPLPVSLSSFTALYENGTPFLNWITQTEENNSHWNIYRSNSENFGQSLKLNNENIEGAGTTSEPTNYEYSDVFEVIASNEYWYWIESVDISGNTMLYSPISILIPEDHNEPIPPEIPKSYGLYDNYPNPFNPDTYIAFALKEESKVYLRVYNIKGKLIKTLFSGETFAADRVIRTNWDGTDNHYNPVASGVYFYQLKAEKKIITKKMLLLK